MADTPKPKAKPKRTKKGKRFASSTGKVQNVKADQTNWRRKMQTARLKFDDDSKQIYLDELAKHGRKGNAAEKAGVSTNLVGDHRKVDPEFSQAEAIALEAYRDTVVAHVQDLSLNGIEVTKYNKEGVIIEERIDYPIPLIMMEAKFVEPGYKESSAPVTNVQVGGVLIAPADMTPEEWLAEAEKANETAECPEPEELQGMQREDDYNG